MFSPPQESGSTLVSVIGDDLVDLGEWKSTVVRQNRVPAQFHAKFWGKSMAEDEREWRSAQSPTRELEEVGDKSMVEGGDLDDGQRGDEILPGCYVLDIGIATLPFSKIWIRADYVRIYGFLEDYYRTITEESSKVPGAVLTGQPGIGKSVWIYYALRRRLAEKKSVIWYHDDTCYLFVEEGVYEIPPRFKPSYFRTVVWTLVDTDTSKDGCPPYLIGHGTRLYVIYVTSPARERWSRMHKTVSRVVVVMNPWTKEEIRHAAPLRLPGSKLDFDRIYDIYDRLGPIPRLCLDYSSRHRELETYELQLSQALEELNATRLWELVTNAAGFSMGEVSSKICLIKRVHWDEPSDNICLTPITDFVAGQLVALLRHIERREQIQLYKSFAFLPGSRGMTGHIFEAYCQVRFRSEIRIEFIPMVRLSDPIQMAPASKKRKSPEGSGGVRQEPRPQWHSSHRALSDEELEKKRQKALRTKSYLNTRPLRTVEYEEDDLGTQREILPNVYYIPKKGNQVALDTFILCLGILYIFQFTGGQSHFLKDGLLPFLKKWTGLPPQENWRFIFIMPDDVEVLKCPFPHSVELQNLGLFSSIMVMDEKRPSWVEFIGSFIPKVTLAW